MSDLYSKFPPQVIQASAGTGKTYRLTNRYISLLFAGLSPDRILATTFTRKAAGEILERVFRRISAGAIEKEGALHLATAFGDASVSQSSCLRKLVELTKQQHRLAICTLDSFCSQIASVFSLELGIPPGWRIADNSTQLRLMREAIQGVLSRHGDDVLFPLLVLLSRGAAEREVQGSMERRISSSISFFYSSAESAWGKLDLEQLKGREEIEELIEMLPTLPAPLTKSGKPDARWGASVAESLRCARGEEWERFIAAGVPKKLITGDTTFYGASIPPETCRAFQLLLEHAIVRLIQPYREESASVHKFLSLFADAYEELKMRARVLTFDDIKRSIALAEEKPHFHDIYYRLDCHFSHLLLDEFQDTSSYEWKVFKPLADELLSKADGESSFFCVGDLKQAIYGWRGGDSRIFSGLNEEWPILGEPETMSNCRRCSAPVIEVVNKVFTSLSHNPAIQSYRRVVDEWSKAFSHHSSECEHLGFVKVETVKGRQSSLIKRGAAIVQEVLLQAPSASVAVLVRSNNAVARCIHALAELGISASEEGDTPVTDSATVRAVLSLLQLADHPGDKIARYHVINTPLSKLYDYTDLSSDREAARVGRTVYDSLCLQGYATVLHRIIAAIVPSCDERDVQRLMQLVELAHSYQPRATTRCRDFIEFVNHQPVESSTGAAVRVMTVHRAKGLEFDAVVLPELDVPMARGKPPILLSRKGPLELAHQVMVTPPSKILALHPDLQRMYSEAESSEVRDALCVLYVGMTRAKRALFMLLPEQEMKGGDVKRAVIGKTFAEVIRHGLDISDDLELGEKLWHEGMRVVPDTRTGGVTTTRAINFQPSSSKRRRALIRQAPSADIQKGAVHLQTLLESPSPTIKVKGEILHRLFASIEWLEDHPQGIDRRELARVLGPDGKFHGDTITEFLDIIGSTSIARLFSRRTFSDGCEVWRERSFALYQGDSVLTGAFDRVVVQRDRKEARGAHIYDFKTEGVAEGMLHDHIELHRRQLEVYREALSTMLNLSASEIKTFLVFTSLREVHEV